MRRKARSGSDQLPGLIPVRAYKGYFRADQLEAVQRVRYLWQAITLLLEVVVANG